MLIFVPAGSSLSEKVHQRPAEMFITSERNSKINCSHDIDSYNRILWYKQSDGDLKLLGYMVGSSGNVEPGVDVKISGDANKGKTCTLTIEDLSLSSSAVYFCAASFHSESYQCSSTQKPPHRSAAPANDQVLALIVIS